MPQGATHERATNVLAIGSSLVLLGLEVPVPDIVALAVGVSSTRLLNPDLDLANSWPAQRWGRLKRMWTPLQAKKHRSFYSHSAIISTLLRVLYILALASAVWIAASILFVIVRGEPLSTLWIAELVNWRLSKFWLAGLVIGDVLQIVMDIIYSALGRE